MLTNNDVIHADLNTGASIPLRPASVTTKKGEVKSIYAVLDPQTGKPAPIAGVLVSPSVVGGGLPQSVTLCGTTITLKTGVTKSGNTKRECVNAPVEVNGEPRALSLRVSHTPSGFRVRGSITMRSPGFTAREAVESL